MGKKELEDKIKSLNFLLLEQKDEINALGHERDRWKELSKLLMQKLGFDFSDDEQPQNLINKI